MLTIAILKVQISGNCQRTVVFSNSQQGMEEVWKNLVNWCGSPLARPEPYWACQTTVYREGIIEDIRRFSSV